LPPKDYVITAEYKGYKVANNIKVLPVLTAKDLVKKYGTPDQFVATLVDGEGKPYAEQKVLFNVNGKLYNKGTDSAGQAKLDIHLPAGQYIITSSYNGANIANKITISG
jgi:sulfur carrier protein ThiS